MSDLWAPSAIRCKDSRNVGTRNAGKGFRSVLHTTQPLGNWRRRDKKGAAIFTTLESAKRWYENFASPYTFLLCISELNSYDYFKSGPKKNQRDLETGIVREGFDALFQICPMNIPGWSMAGNYKGGYPSNWVSPYTPQLSIMGCAEDVHSWDDVIYGKIAAAEAEIYQLMRTIEGYESVTCMPYRTKGIGGRAYGSKGYGRMLVDSWMNNTGGKITGYWNMCAHSDLPGRNTWSGKVKPGQTHWDAPFDFVKIAEMVNEILDPGTKPKTAQKKKAADPQKEIENFVELAMKGLSDVESEVRKVVNLLKQVK